MISRTKDKRMLVDSACVDIAKHFLADVPDATDEDRTELAEAVQKVCEEFCTGLTPNEWEDA